MKTVKSELKKVAKKHHWDQATQLETLLCYLEEYHKDNFLAWLKRVNNQPVSDPNNWDSQSL